ncbi:Crp/Fnr family transcriptional regulator [Enterococcus faecium]|uniref:Crp/Fnr family transcriptional regulator n=2 Tax=Enterococcus faecium TaxID=1352 RepID=UPI0011237D78|nr:Crp/Fnr family transcriptional regulator [Enterococcus faecium]TNX40574.1 Crp/Fnr family transcriptional regulator [Enterococcus faecium]HAZ0650925.1 Crp/Fnr family transcriptional regulator [Enterococcus faecium]
MNKLGCLCKVPLFNPLTMNEKNNIRCLLHHKTFQKGELIFSPGDQEQLSIVASGAMRIYRISKTGKEQFIRIVKEGEYDGENYLFGLINDSLYGEAIKETKVCILYKTEFNKLIELYPQLSCRLLQLNARKTVELERQLELLALDRIEDRLALYISRLSPLPTIIEDEIVTLPLSMKELANYLATSPETISRKFKNFQERKLIIRKGKKVTLLKTFWNEFNFL